jgi:hypothetical protein
MSPQTALDLITYFLQHAFEVPRDSIYSPPGEDITLPPHTFHLFNANLLFYKALAILNPHVPYDLNYLLKPENYANEWKTICAVLLDFMNFKD